MRFDSPADLKAPANQSIQPRAPDHGRRSFAGGSGRVKGPQQLDTRTVMATTATLALPPAPQALGYVGVRAKDLGDWANYGSNLLGLQRIDKSRATLAFRMDDRKQRILVDADGGEGISFFGWEVADAAALDAFAAHLERNEIKIARGTRVLADERRVRDLIVLADPLGNRIEIFHGAETTADPFRPGRSISGFRTGPLGLGHVVLNVDSRDTIDRLMTFYRGTLGFRLTDYYDHPFVARFLHLNPRHHSLAFIQTGKNAVHHIMMELFSFDDVGQGYDITLGEAGRVATTLGRHTSDFITSFYSWTPSAFMVEYGWGARSIDVATWQASERKEGPSMWGHDRVWLSKEDNAKARAVQVMDGNYQVMSGVCPWWDSVKAKTAAQ